MDAVFLSRIQFAITIGFHFIFPPISIGLVWLLVIAEYIGWRKNDEIWVNLGRFFAKLLGLTFVVGVATGIVMEFQFGMNWAKYSEFVGDIFGAPLAAEAVFAFFLESSFLALYLFGRNRVSKGVHWFSVLMVAVGATMSAFWILVANSWQQTPAGYVIRNGRAELTSFAEAVFNPSMFQRFFHTVDATLIAGAFFMAGIAAFLLLKNKDNIVARKAIKLSCIFGIIVSVLAVFPTGHESARQVARTQPEKFAAIEGLYTSQSNAPLVLFGVVNHLPSELAAKIEIPGLLSWMAFGDVDAPVVGINDFPPDEIPPLWPTFVSFHNMVMLGMYFIGVMALALFLLWRKKIWDNRLFLKLLVFSLPLPIVAIEFGWAAAEIGRQPWIVYKLLRTSEAASVNVSAGEILFSIILFSVVYIFLGALWVFLVARETNHFHEATAKEVQS